MKKAVRLAGELIASVLICALLGFVLLMLVYLIPAERIEPKVRDSAAVFESEGHYPYVNSISGSSMLDNYTDALMILSAVYPGEESLTDRVSNVYHQAIPGLFHTSTLVQLYGHIKFSSEPVIAEPYGRYWHGYLAILKPLLCFLDYGAIRFLDMALIIAVAAVTIFLLYRKRMKPYIIPYLLLLLLLDPFAISNSLQYSWVFYTASVSSIILLSKMDKWGNDLERYAVFFAVTGCVTSYLDLLTYPVVTLGIPSIIWLCRNRDDLKTGLKMLLCMCVSWGFGYFGMWALKWIIGSLFTSGALLGDALSQAAFRVSMTDKEGAAISLVSVFKGNLERLASSPVAVITLIYIIILAVIAILHIKKIASSDRRLSGLMFIAAGLIPAAWYVFMSNHSYVHDFYTYRDLAVSVFAILCMLTGYVGMSGKDSGSK